MDFSITDEQRMFRNNVYRYALHEISPLCEQADLKGEFSMEIWEKLAAYGLTGLPFPEDLGGSGADIVTCCLAGEALAHAGVDGGSLLALGAHMYLCAHNIFSFGTEDQRRRYIPDLASGKKIGCMCLTEPGAGSDAASIGTTAVKHGDTWFLNGSKTFITNAPVADVFVIFASVNRTRKHEGITAFIVERGTKGLSTGKPFDKMGCRCSATSEVFLDNCEVPAENLLGGEGKGWMIALSGVEWDRCTLLSPLLGAALFNLDACARYANERFQFERPIRNFQAIGHRIADMKIFVEATRLAIYRVASAKDRGRMLNPLQAAVSKVYAGDRGFELASEAVQVFGGYGFMHEFPVERNFRDCKLAAIGGGTSDIMRMIVSRIMLMTEGRQDTGPLLSEEQADLRDRAARFCAGHIEPGAGILDRATSDVRCRMARESLAILGSEGLLSSGHGTDAPDMVNTYIVSHEIARACPATFITMRSSAFMCGGLITLYGTDEQKKRYLPGLLRGELAGAVAWTEEHAGSDIRAIETTACRENSEWVLLGSKNLVVNGPIMDIVVVLARTVTSMSLFIVDGNAEGLRAGSPVETMGLRGAPVSPVYLDRCHGELLGDVSGGGFESINHILSMGSVGIAALGTGIGSRCMELSTAHARGRKAFGRGIGMFQDVGFRLADMFTLNDLGRMMALRAAGAWNNSDPDAVLLSACAKLFTAEACTKTAGMAMGIFAGHGYVSGTEIERLYRDARFCEICEGTPEILRDLIAKHEFDRFA